MTNASTVSSAKRTWCTEWELASGGDLTVAPAGLGAAVRVLVRRHGETIDFVEIDDAGASIATATLLDGLTAAGRRRLDRHEQADRAGECPSTRRAFTSSVTLVVCTRNRAAELPECLQALGRLDYPALEIVIVDNAPSDDSTLRCFRETVGDDVRFRYVREPVPGLSRARNCGLAAATGEIIAYTDDDVRVDPEWIRALATPFERDEVACVTGLVCTASLDTPAEHYFDAKVSWSANCAPAEYHLDSPVADPLYPYASGLFGTGAAMAFRTQTLRELGGFDEALGAGTRTAGGEDLDIFVQVLLAGQTLVYAPSAVAWHRHRADVEGLRRQMFGYGSGLTAYLTKHLLHRRSRRTLLTRIPRGLKHMTGIARGAQRAAPPQELPARALLLREMAGMAMGPALYLAARRRTASGPTASASETVEVA
jgi:GT2 family glycosyltransferase